jgi:hypothetical protein
MPMGHGWGLTTVSSKALVVFMHIEEANWLALTKSGRRRPWLCTCIVACRPVWLLREKLMMTVSITLFAFFFFLKELFAIVIRWVS